VQLRTMIALYKTMHYKILLLVCEGTIYFAKITLGFISSELIVKSIL
jgi:hypothetical protein